MAIPLMLANILGGLGQGVGGAGAALAAQREDDRKIAVQQEQARHNRAIEEAATAQHLVDVTPEVVTTLKSGGLDLSPFLGKKIPTSVYTTAVGAAEKVGAENRERAERTAVSDILAGARGAPGQPTGALAPDEDPEAAAFIGSKGFRAPMSMDDMRAALSKYKIGPALFKDMYPQDKYASTREGAIYNTTTGAVSTPAPTTTKAKNVYHVNTDKGVMEVVKDEAGNTLSERVVGGLPPHQPPQPTASVTIDKLTQEKHALLAGGASPEDPRIKNLDERINSQKLVPFVEGGGVQGPAGIVRPASPKPPEASERKELAGLDTSRAGVQALIKDFDKNQGVLGNTLSNPVGALRRGAGSVLPTLTQDERQFLAGLSLRVAEIKRELIGLAQTIPELRTLADALPDKGEIGPAVYAKLVEIDKLLETKRASLGNVLQQSNRSVPKPPAPGMSDADRKAAQKYGL